MQNAKVKLQANTTNDFHVHYKRKNIVKVNFFSLSLCLNVISLLLTSLDKGRRLNVHNRFRIPNSDVRDVF